LAIPHLLCEENCGADKTAAIPFNNVQLLHLFLQECAGTGIALFFNGAVKCGNRIGDSKNLTAHCRKTIFHIVAPLLILHG